MLYLFVAVSFLISVVIASLLIPRILVIATRKKLYDVPDARKVHTKAIPRLGGVSFYPTILFSVCMMLALRTLAGYDVAPSHAPYMGKELLLLVCGMTLLYLIGIADDLMGVRYRQKFLIQVFCAALFPLAGLWVNDLYGICGIHAIPWWLGVPLTMFLVVFVTNAINLIDGIDGLASGLSSVALVVFGTLFLLDGLWGYSMVAFATLGVLVPFFYYNVFGSATKARKIFMGDTGSLTLGYIISFLALKYSMNNPEVMPYKEGALIIAASTLIIPIFDVVRVVLVRLRNGKNPFEPDRNHIHHKFLDMGYSVRRTMVMLILLACGLACANIVLIHYMNGTWVLLGDVALWIAMHLVWSRKRKKAIHRTACTPEPLQENS